MTFVKALIEYSQQGRQKRAEHFFALRHRLKETPEFAEIAALLDTAGAADKGLADAAEAELAAMPFQVKRDYLGLFEEVALAVNSGLVKRQVAHYMFGYYAILCWESQAFWSNVNKFSEYWKLYEDFYWQMKEQQRSFAFDRADFRF